MCDFKDQRQNTQARFTSKIPRLLAIMAAHRLVGPSSAEASLELLKELKAIWTVKHLKWPGQQPAPCQ